MSEWQTMDTAPRDGSSIFVWDGEKMLTARWDRDDWGQSGFVTGYFMQNPEWVYPTHWQPLPEPPASANMPA